MTEERLEEIKDSIILQKIACKTNKEATKLIDEELELYNEVVRLREIINRVIEICENEKKYVYDKVKREEKTGKLIFNNKIEVDLVNKTKILEILKQYNLTLEQLTGIVND